MKKLLLAALMALAHIPAVAAETPARPDADPALWVVRDADTTIYLFGTFHLLDGRRDWFNDEVRTAFDRSNELVLEFVMPENLAELQPAMMRFAAAEGGRTLAQRLPAPLHARLAGELAELGLSAAGFETLDPWFVAMTLGTVGAERVGITGAHGPETVLGAAARARGMPVGGVETIEDQLGAMDGLSEAAQIAQLEQTIDAMDGLAEAFEPLTLAWATGDSERLFEMMNGQKMDSPELYRATFPVRNARWTRWIRERMARPGTVFIAVGAGHLAGPDSVQAMLAAHGLRAERVTG